MFRRCETSRRSLGPILHGQPKKCHSSKARRWSSSPCQRCRKDSSSPWGSFLRDLDNKRELFNFLAKCIERLHVRGVTIYSTFESQVLCTDPGADLQHISPCNQEEADTRLILHAADCVRQGLLRVLIRTTDTDVLVLAVTHVPQISRLAELWVSFGSGKSHKFIAAHSMANTLSKYRYHGKGNF